MKRIATITFHRAQNFGSVLQTYALKEYVEQVAKEHNVDVTYSVIDLSSDSQKQLYRHFKKVRGINDIVKNIFTLVYSGRIKKREEKFSEFLGEYLPLTEEMAVQENLGEKITADYYISGSDQIWNVRAKDFADFYFLDFVSKGKKISYAASFGPLKIDWEKYDAKKYTRLLNEYSAISVRERGSATNVRKLTGRTCPVHVDPTMLLNRADWRKIQSDANYNNGKYILLYCLEPSKKQLKMAEAISKKLKLPIVILRYNNKNDMVNGYVKKYDAGPKDFLAYIDHAALVLSSSFHGTVFSLLYHKPFYVFNGMNDNRISSILKRTGMEERSIDKLEDVSRVSVDELDGDSIEKVLNQERNASRKYLVEVLEFDKKN